MTTAEQDRLTAIEQRLERIEAMLTQAHEAIAPIMANPSKWLARLMGGGR